MNELEQLMEELIQLREKIAKLEREDLLFKETEKSGKIGGWQFDPKTLKQTWTEEVFRILEIDINQEAPKVPQGLDFIDHGYRPMAEKAIQRAMDHGEQYNQEWQVTTFRGNKKWVNAVCIPKIKDGKVIAVSGSFQDITSEKKAKEELKKSEERLRVVIDNSPFPVAVVDEKDQVIQYWSKSAIELFGHNPKTTEEWYELAYPNPEYRQKVIERWKPFVGKSQVSGKAVNTGEYEICCKNGSVKICTIYAQFIPDTLIVTLNDITERKKNEEQLKKIEWLLLPKKKKDEVRIPDYGDLTELNQNRLILDSVGKEVLNEIVSDYLSLLETSAAVYEKNGDYAVGIFSSEWCQFMDCSSRGLCKSKDNRKALESGKWLCHESCWTDASYQSIESGKAADIECSGGLHIYAIPIRANKEVIGSINFGYGNPPTNEDKLTEIAAKYNVAVDKLKILAQSYETRPAFIIDIAKEKLETSAKLIGNIVERNEMERKLMINEARYQKAQEIGHVGNWEYNPVTTEFWGSDEARKIYGFRSDPVVFSTDRVEKCIPEKKRVHQALVDLIEHDKKYNIIFDILTEDKGVRKTIHSIAELLRDAQGNPVRISGVISDITSQKKAEDKLKALNQQLRANEQQLKAANQQLQASEQQLRAANQQLQASEQQLMAANQQLRAVNQQLSANEKQLIVKNQQLLKAKEKAEESEEQLYRIANNFVDGMIYQVAMLDENKRKFNYVSEAVTRLYGCTPEQVKENPDLIYGKLHPDDVSELIKVEKEALKNMSVFKTECRVINPDGSIRWSYYISQPRIINDIVCWDGIEVDITKQKLIEYELHKAKEKAEESDRLKSAFLSNMSHEIRTPMNGILGFSSLLKKPKLTGEQQKVYIDIIEKSGYRMLNIINDIVDISKIESGTMEVKLKRTNINKQLDYILTFFKPEIESKNLALILKKTIPEDEADILTDSEKIYAVLLNLVKNAIKYTDEGHIEFGYTKKGKDIVFFVKDTGIGIPKDRHSAIFERFIQADISDIQARQGAGLGLSISKAYVEMLKGRIWVESEEGKGSSFYFSIPYTKVSDMESDIDTRGDDDLPQLNLKTVIVEDDETSAKLISLIVEKYGKEIISLTNGNEALEVCRRNPDIDLILMDIQIPGMNGYEVTREIRKFNKEVIIIAQTAYGFAGDRELALRAGCNDYISKPISEGEFATLLHRYFNQLV